MSSRLQYFCVVIEGLGSKRIVVAAKAAGRPFWGKRPWSGTLEAWRHAVGSLGLRRAGFHFTFAWQACLKVRCLKSTRRRRPLRLRWMLEAKMPWLGTVGRGVGLLDADDMPSSTDVLEPEAFFST